MCGVGFRFGFRKVMFWQLPCKANSKQQKSQTIQHGPYGLRVDLQDLRSPLNIRRIHLSKGLMSGFIAGVLLFFCVFFLFSGCLFFIHFTLNRQTSQSQDVPASTTDHGLLEGSRPLTFGRPTLKRLAHPRNMGTLIITYTILGAPY